jgi:type I restriction enzyme M protein
MFCPEEGLMGRKESQRYNHREKALEFVRSGRELTQEEIAYIKKSYSGIGGLCPSDWSHGAFFTPPCIIEFIHAIVGVKKYPGRVIELACGAGGFFEGLDASHCTGIEVSRDSYEIAKACHPKTDMRQDVAQEIFPYDKPSKLDGEFDYCLGNPPYGMSIAWGGDICEGKVKKIPSEYVFMEIAYRAVKPGGKIALVVPDGLLNTTKALVVRKWLMDRCYVRAVISLPPTTFFNAGTTVKTSVLYLQKFPSEMSGRDIPNYQIFMAICTDIGWDSRGRLTQKEDLTSVLEAWKAFDEEWIPTGPGDERQPVDYPLSPLEKAPCHTVPYGLPPAAGSNQGVMHHEQLGLFS